MIISFISIILPFLYFNCYYVISNALVNLNFYALSYILTVFKEFIYMSFHCSLNDIYFNLPSKTWTLYFTVFNYDTPSKICLSFYLKMLLNLLIYWVLKFSCCYKKLILYCALPKLKRISYELFYDYCNVLFKP